MCNSKHNIVDMIILSLQILFLYCTSLNRSLPQINAGLVLKPGLESQERSTSLGLIVCNLHPGKLKDEIGMAMPKSIFSDICTFV